MRFLLTCAGTAGHINPAIAVADALKRAVPEAEFLFIGSGREMENRLIPAAGYEIRNIRVTGLERSLGLRSAVSRIQTVRNLIRGRREAGKILREFRPDAVIGTGGYVCFPVLRSAKAQKIPCFLHESNAVPGLTTKLLTGTADRIFTAFPGTESSYRKPEKVTFAGTPVRSGFISMTKEEARRQKGWDDGNVVVSFWGSLGASVCNQCTAEAIVLNEREGRYRLIHATGEDGYGAFRDALSGRGLDPDGLKYAEVKPYIHDMPVVMQAADLVLCRSGASTLAELTAIGKPAVLIPSPYVTDNHQEKNAKRLTETGGAVMLREADCTGGLLHETVAGLLADGERLARMSENIRSAGVPDSADRITRCILDLLDAGKGEES